MRLDIPSPPVPSAPLVLLPAVALLVLLGGALVVHPPAVGLAVVGAACLTAALLRPWWGFVAFLLVQVLAPLYLAVPIVPGLPAFPLSLIVLIATAAIVLARVGAPGGAWRHPITLAFLIYGAALLVSVLRSSAPTSTMNPLLRCFFAPFAAYLMTLYLVASPRRAIAVLNVLLLAATAASLYGLIEFAIGWNPLIENLAQQTGDVGDLLYWQQADYQGNIYRSFSVETNPLYFGTVVSMLLPYAVARASTASTAGSRALFALAAGLCFAGIGATFSRGPLMASVLAVIGMAFVLRPVRRLVVPALAAAVLCGLAALPWIGAEIWDRLSDADNVTMRLKLWELSWAMFRDAPLTGVGLNGFGHHQIDVLRAHQIGPFPERALNELENLATADGTLPQLAAEVGLVGLLAFGGLLATASAGLLRALRDAGPTSRLVAASVGAAACAYLVNGLTITIYIAYTPTVLLSVLFGLVAACDGAGAPGAADARGAGGSDPAERDRP